MSEKLTITKKKIPDLLRVETWQEEVPQKDENKTEKQGQEDAKATNTLKKIRKRRKAQNQFLTPYQKEAQERFEYLKSRLQKLALETVNEVICEKAKELGEEPFKLTEENYHILPSDLYKAIRGKENPAFSNFEEQSVALNVKYCGGSIRKLVELALHETLHLNGFLRIQVKGDDIKSTRQGMSVRSTIQQDLKDEKHEHFRGFHEALMGETTKRLLEESLSRISTKIKKVSSGQLSDKDREEFMRFIETEQWLDSKEAKEKKKEISEKNNVPIEDIFWVSGKELQITSPDSNWEEFSYGGPRKTLNYVIKEIAEASGETEEEIRNKFLKTHFSGKEKSVTYLMRQTFDPEHLGKDGRKRRYEQKPSAFEVLGAMEVTYDSAQRQLDTLKKMRQKVKNQQK